MNNNNNFINNNNAINNSNISGSFKNIGNEFKLLSNKISINIVKRWNRLNTLQKVTIIILFIGLPAFFLLKFLYNKVFKKRNLNPTLSDLNLFYHKSIPLISFIGKNKNGENNLNFVKNIFTKYYNKKNYVHKKIKNGDINYKLQLRKDKVNNQFTYSFWMYINNDSGNCLNKYLNKKMNLEGDNLNYNWFNYRNDDYKLILHRGEELKDNISTTELFQYPGFWLDPKMTNLSVIFANNGKNESFILENLDLNKWINITCVIDGFAIFLYKNGKLQLTGTLKNVYPSVASTNIFYLGGNNTSIRNIGFPGYLAYFNYYNRVLLSEDVNELYKENLEKIRKNKL